MMTMMMNPKRKHSSRTSLLPLQLQLLLPRRPMQPRTPTTSTTTTPTATSPSTTHSNTCMTTTTSCQTMPHHNLDFERTSNSKCSHRNVNRRSYRTTITMWPCLSKESHKRRRATTRSSTSVPSVRCPSRRSR